VVEGLQLGPNSPLLQHPTRRPQTREEDEQIALVRMIFGPARKGEPYTEPLPGLPRDLRFLAAVPNGGGRSAAQAGRFKAQGVRRGYPDLILDVARGGWHGLRLEFKPTDGPKPRPEQTGWLEELGAQGYCAASARGVDAAFALLLRYVQLSCSAVGPCEDCAATLAQLPGVTLHGMVRP
jgi:hypothetical protein